MVGHVNKSRKSLLIYSTRSPIPSLDSRLFLARIGRAPLSSLPRGMLAITSIKLKARLNFSEAEGIAMALTEWNFSFSDWRWWSYKFSPPPSPSHQFIARHITPSRLPSPSPQSPSLSSGPHHQWLVAGPSGSTRMTWTTRLRRKQGEMNYEYEWSVPKPGFLPLIHLLLHSAFGFSQSVVVSVFVSWQMKKRYRLMISDVEEGSAWREEHVHVVKF
jgi:hypothetical protein